MCLSGSAAHVQGCAQFYCSDGFLAEKQSGTDPEPLGLGWLLAGGSLPGAAGLAALVCATHSWDLPVLSTESLLHSSPRSPALQELWAGAAGTQLPRELPPSWGWGDPPEVPWAPQHPQEKLPGALAMHQQLNLPLLPVSLWDRAPTGAVLHPGWEPHAAVHPVMGELSLATETGSVKLERE